MSMMVETICVMLLQCTPLTFIFLKNYHAVFAIKSMTTHCCVSVRQYYVTFTVSHIERTVNKRVFVVQRLCCVSCDTVDMCVSSD